jgi:putative transposase
MGKEIEASSRSTSKSAVSRRFVAATETALTELMASDLTELDLVAIMIDGVHFAGFTCAVALGIDIDGDKHPLAVEEGDTENATLVNDLLAGLRERGLDMTKPILAVLDGAKALCAGIQAVFDHPVIARCQLHKIRNVESKLPDDVARVVVKEMRAARSLRSTNGVESMIEICRDHARNVKHWRDGQMALRWCAAGMVEAKKQF